MTWQEILHQETKKPYFVKMWRELKTLYQTKTIYPAYENIFNAFNQTPYDEVRVVILGQDPYYQPNQAHGLAFSVPTGEVLPPSLKNIYKEIEREYGIRMSRNGNLTKWAKQGVLLLNTTLTVEKNKPTSHCKIGWETFTDNIIKTLNDKEEQVIFLLWGNNAKKKIGLITNPIHKILTSPHPSPLSAYHGFIGNDHFKQVNELLTGKSIDWRN